MIMMLARTANIRVEAFNATGGGNGGGTYDAATDAWVSNVVAYPGGGGVVSDPRKRVMDDLIVGLKADGIWTKLDRLWLFAGENQASALVDLTHGSIATLINAPTLTVDRGYTGDGSSKYIDTNFNPTIGPNKHLQDDAHWGHWNNTNDISNQLYSGVNNSATGFQANAGQLYLRINDGAGPISATNPTGLWVDSRQNSSGSSVYRNGSLSQNITVGTGALTNQNFYVLAATGGTPSPTQCAAYSIGGGLTATEIGNFYTRLRTYMTAVRVLGPALSGLVLRYECDDMVTADTSGNGNTGTISGSGTTLVAGKFGSALSFDGNGYITFTSVTALGLASAATEFSVACWIKTTNIDGCIYSIRNSGSGNPIINLVVGYNGVDNVNTGKLSVIVRDDVGAGLKNVNAPSAINDGNWHHVALTRTTGQLLTLYQDGVSVASGTDTMTTGITPNVSGSAIAKDILGGVPTIVGLLDDLQVYNRALTSPEVASLAIP